MQIEITREECTTLWMAMNGYAKDHAEMMDSIRAANKTLGLDADEGCDQQEQDFLDALVEKLARA